MLIQQMLLTKNRFSRCGVILKNITKIAIHYVGNTNTSALNNHKWFESLKDQKTDSTYTYLLNSGGSYKRDADGNKIKASYVSSHFIVGLQGEVIQNLPLNEMSYCTNDANSYSISIECCHPKSDGQFNEATTKSLTELCVYLCNEFKLDPIKDIIRHYDVTGKECPLYWSPTKYQSATIANGRFNEFKNSVKALMTGMEDTPKIAEDAVNNKEFTPYRVQIVDPALNIRIKPGVSNPIVGVITDKGVYTIVAEEKVGDAIWGYLKSGVGAINVGEKYVKRLK